MGAIKYYTMYFLKIGSCIITWAYTNLLAMGTVLAGLFFAELM